VGLLAWQVAFGAPLAWRQRLNDFGVAGAYLIAPAVWVILPYQLSKAEAGQSGGYLSGAQAGIESLLASPSRLHQFLHARFLGHFEREPDAFLFPGILVIVLAAVAVASWPARRRLRENHVAFYLLIGVVSSAMFIPGPLSYGDTSTGCRA
jgi:hypothetical protein